MLSETRLRSDISGVLPLNSGTVHERQGSLRARSARLPQTRRLAYRHGDLLAQGGWRTARAKVTPPTSKAI